MTSENITEWEEEEQEDTHLFCIGSTVFSLNNGHSIKADTSN